MEASILVDTATKILAQASKEAKEKKLNEYTASIAAKKRFYDEQLKADITSCEQIRANNEARVKEKLLTDPDYTGSRRAGVEAALHETYLLALHYNVWPKKLTDTQKQGLLDTRKLTDMYGHHIFNVADHPELQGCPDNITFYTFIGHLNAHKGDFRKPTEGKLEHRLDQMMTANTLRVVKNEVAGFAGIAVPAAIENFGRGFFQSIKEKKPFTESLKRGLYELPKCILPVADYTFRRVWAAFVKA